MNVNFDSEAFSAKPTAQMCICTLAPLEWESRMLNNIYTFCLKMNEKHIIIILIHIDFVAFGTRHSFVEWIFHFHSHWILKGNRPNWMIFIFTQLWMSETLFTQTYTREQWTKLLIFSVSPSVYVCFWYIMCELKYFLVQFKITYRWALFKSKII